MNEPKNIRGLVEKFGADQVWFAALELLEFPITWAPSGADVNRVALFLSNRK